MMQLPFLSPLTWGLLLAIVFSVAAVGSIIELNVRARNRHVHVLETMLVSRMAIPVIDLANGLGKRPLDRSSTLAVIKRSRNAMLSFAGSSVVSVPMLTQRLRSLLTDSSAIHVADECKRWELTDDQISSLVETITKAEGMDVVLTKDGDFILVTDFKGRMRDVLNLGGRLDISSEAQRMRVDSAELRNLVQTWGWGLVEGSDGSLVSSRWLKSTLERAVDKLGYLDPKAEAARLHIPIGTIMETTRQLRWTLIETWDGRQVPTHLLEQHLVDSIRKEGYIDLEAKSKELKVGVPQLLGMLRTAGLRIVSTKEHSVATIEYVRDRVRDDMQLSGWVSPDQEAELLGVDKAVIEDILRNQSGLRRGRDGRYVSLESFRRWLLQEAEEVGVIRLSDAEAQWGLSSLELQVLAKESGLSTVLTHSGDFLSTAFARRKIQSDLSKGTRVEAANLARELDIDPTTAEAIMGKVKGDGLVTEDGSLVPMSLLRKSFQQAFSSTGIVDLVRESRSHKLDISDLRRIVAGLGVQTLETATNKLVDVSWIINGMREALKVRGLFDLATLAKTLELDYVAVVEVVEKRLEGEEIVVDPAGAVVSSKWVADIRQYASATDMIPVTQLATELNLHLEAVLHLLKRFVGGLYNSRTDSFTPRLRQNGL